MALLGSQRGGLVYMLVALAVVAALLSRSQRAAERLNDLDDPLFQPF